MQPRFRISLYLLVNNMEDKVRAEFPISLASARSDLLLLQYPLRPKTRPYEGLIAVQYKPGKCVIEQTYELDSAGANYDRTAVEFKVKQVKLKSSVISHVSQYCVLSLQKDSATMTPIKGVLRLKPVFDHVDTELAGRNLKPEVEEANKETYRSRKKAKVQPKAEEEEPWLDLALSESKSIEDELKPWVSIPCKAPPVVEAVANRDKGTLEAILELPVSLQVEEALKRLHVTSAAELAEILEQPNEALLQPLHQKACLIQGRWVYRSELMYGSDAQRKADLRDLVVLALVKGPVSKTEYFPISLHTATGTSYEELHSILSTLAELSSKLWTLKEPPLDNALPTKVIEDSAKYWSGRVKR